MELIFFWLYPSKEDRCFIFGIQVQFFTQILMIIFRADGMLQGYRRNDISILSYCGGKLITKS